MASVDQAAISSSIDGYRLMEIAGAALAACVLKHYPDAQNAAVLCGPGNNGGDGYVAARHLRAVGLPVSVHSLVDVAKLVGDAAKARDEWAGPISALNAMTLHEGSIVVDALFGGGLDRAIEGNAAATINAINLAGVPVIAADIPSGISGRSGESFGTAYRRTTRSLLSRRGRATTCCRALIIVALYISSTLASPVVSSRLCRFLCGAMTRRYDELHCPMRNREITNTPMATSAFSVEDLPAREPPVWQLWPALRLAQVSSPSWRRSLRSRPMPLT